MNQKMAIRQLKALEKIEVKKEMGLAAEEWDEEWKTLIAIIMSAQSRDETTVIIAEALFARYLTLESLAKAKYEDVLAVFSGLNYNKTKAKNVIGCARMLIENYGGKVPHDLDKLVELPGVGRKTANVFLSEYGADAIGVDTHVFQIATKLGWSKANTREKVEEDLRKLFPQNIWKKINPLLVRFGKTHTSRKQKDFILDQIKSIV